MRTHQSQSGFSLVETLVAITILLIVVVGPLTISTSTARSTNFSSEQVQAFFLAQEGVELVQAARDDILLSAFPDISTSPTVSDAWSDFESTTGSLEYCLESDGCGLYASSTADGFINVIDCDPITACRLYINADIDERSRFTHVASSNATPFTRRISISPVSAGTEVRVISTVTWRSGNLRDQQEVSVESYLFNVYENL